MRLLLDTNVLSKATKPRPDQRVLSWLHGLNKDRTFISIVSIAEICRGVALMDTGRKRDALAEWLAYDLPRRFEDTVVPVALVARRRAMKQYMVSRTWVRTASAPKRLMRGRCAKRDIR